jgi:general secretion pathway protein G
VSRRGFTLIELLVVIVIISILTGMLLGGLGAVRSRVREAEVAVDIKGLETSITQFKAEFGMEPPSLVFLYEAATGDPSWAVDTSAPTRLVQSRTLIRQLWPQFDFTAARNLNGDMDTTDRFVLTGDECLVFFLGGAETIIDPAAATPDLPVVNGFSKNPRNPFATGGSRIGPFFEFKPERMFDFESSLSATDDGVLSYDDAFPADSLVPYLYLSSYNGQGYRPGVDGDFNNDSMVDAQLELANVYLQRDNDLVNVGDASEVPWKQNTYQIISAGNDGEFGVGGVWSQEDGFTNTTVNARDRDNFTNFSSGALD